VDAITRAANVEAFIVWSPYSTNVVSSTRASCGSGSAPCSIHRKFPAWLRAGFGGTTSRPVRNRSNVAISVGVSAIRRIAFRYSASGESSQPSGSNALEAEMPVRSIDIGEEFWASVGSMRARNG